MKYLARIFPCAVERRVFLVGANPAQQLSLSVGISRGETWRQLHARKMEDVASREAQPVACTRQPGPREGAGWAGRVADRPAILRTPGNAGQGKGPDFERETERGQGMATGESLTGSQGARNLQTVPEVGNSALVLLGNFNLVLTGDAAGLERKADARKPATGVLAGHYGNERPRRAG